MSRTSMAGISTAVLSANKMANSPIKGRIRQAKRDKIKFNLMVVGETGLGKTTFLYSLLRRYIDNFSIPNNDEGPAKTLKITNVGKFEILTDAGDGLDIVLYDSPGFGDFINNQTAIKTIKADILKRHQDWKRLDAQSMTEAEFLQADDRIHCIFYFIAPHRFKAIDTEFLKELAPLASIIPVVAKSDIMTIKERNDYLESVRRKIEALSKDLNESCVYDFQGDDIEVMEVKPEESTPDEHGNFTPTYDDLSRVPNLFGIVCDESAERVYPWGTIKIDNEKVSDFRRLQTILFENEHHLKGMMDNTRKKSIRLPKV